MTWPEPAPPGQAAPATGQPRGAFAFGRFGGNVRT